MNVHFFEGEAQGIEDDVWCEEYTARTRSATSCETSAKAAFADNNQTCGA